MQDATNDWHQGHWDQASPVLGQAVAAHEDEDFSDFHLQMDATLECDLTEKEFPDYTHQEFLCGKCAGRRSFAVAIEPLRARGIVEYARRERSFKAKSRWTPS